MTSSFDTLRDVFRKLRDPEHGCPWDLKQTHETLLPYLIEEAYEFCEAVRHQPDAIKEELGDVLLQVMLHSQIAEDDKSFSIEDVMDTLSHKMIHRHPHVFAETEVSSAEEVLKNWNEIKREEKKEKGASVFEDVGRSLPSLLHAQELGKKAKGFGLDWNQADDILVKLQEEVTEFSTAQNQDEQEDEFGDLLFTLVQFARHKNINAEVALQRSCEKFRKRVQQMQKKSEHALETLSAEELDRLWESTKRKSEDL